MKHSRIFTIILSVFVIISIIRIQFTEIGLGTALIVFLIAYVYTDLLSGVLHIILDNERSLNLSIVSSLARGFQEHHRTPNTIHEMSLYDHLYTMHLPLVMAFPPVVLMNFNMGYFVYLNFVIMLHLMQMAHRWAHMPSSRVHFIVKFLQHVGLLVSRKNHLTHHDNVYNTNFCIMNGWFNAPLNFAVRKFGRTSHGWIAVFLSLVALAFIVPAIIYL